ncbi:hypothetical protein BS47DRAFT_1403194 [Hydnum rufescens UP504]|uniref:Uncharacterized protein n=1 Tax=Hydnum rufescens UP504 TaxID=1448309 RepID=A0A9P6DL39_9AGAM|nr:hypothetical protein BS47DRAFT_1403194 [Hydnum rufescens UP504]
MLTSLHMRKRLQARLDTPSLLELMGSSMENRIRRNVRDHENRDEAILTGTVHFSSQRSRGYEDKYH